MSTIAFFGEKNATFSMCLWKSVCVCLSVWVSEWKVRVHLGHSYAYVCSDFIYFYCWCCCFFVFVTCVFFICSSFPKPNFIAAPFFSFHSRSIYYFLGNVEIEIVASQKRSHGNFLLWILQWSSLFFLLVLRLHLTALWSIKNEQKLLKSISVRAAIVLDVLRNIF